MPEIERRQTPRTTMERLAYINIEPNNGGIVLNVSDQGLCFHSIAPVVRNGKLRFSLLEHNHRIEADGELVWMDDEEKVGGVRFAALPAEARAQIQSWITEPAGPFTDHESTATPVSHPSAFSALGERWSTAAAAPAAATRPLGAATTERRQFLGGFSAGLAIGLLIAALVTAGFLFHSFRHQLGDSLIRLGQQLSKTQTQAQGPTAASQTPPVSSQPTLPASPSTVPAPASTAVAPQQKPVLQAKLSSTETQPEATQPESSTEAPIKVARGRAANPANVATPSLSPPQILVSGNSAAPIAKLIAEKADTLPRFAGAVSSNVHTEDAGAGVIAPPPKMYFEVGKFKQESWARKATDELAQLGFPTSVTQKGRLWGNSYYVLVGPYNDRDTADLAHKNLASSGFKPRPFERGSRSFTLSSGVILNRTRMVGDFVIRWESYIPDAKVKFLQDDLLVTSADGRWVERGIKNQRNAFVYQRNPDGTHTLLEIRFAGMSKVLVFANPS